MDPSNENHRNLILEKNKAKNYGELWLGNKQSAIDTESLKAENVTSVQTVMTTNTSSKIIQLYKDKNITHKIVEIMDDPNSNILCHFEYSTQYIESTLANNNNILVHCLGGRSRSATIIIAYLIKFRKMTWEEAQAYVKDKRPIVCPNDGFIKQLQEWAQICQYNQEFF